MQKKKKEKQHKKEKTNKAIQKKEKKKQIKLYKYSIKTCVRISRLSCTKSGEKLIH